MNPEPRPEEEWTTAVPKTYCIEYGTHHVRNAQYVAQIGEAPPNVLHVGWDTAINNMCGPTVHGPGEACYDSRRLSPAELEERIRALREFTDAMHTAGVEILMPYQSGSFFFGEHTKRLRFYDFYDHWNDYAEFGIGPRPQADPAEWQGRDRRGQGGSQQVFVYEPCINHPGWIQVCRMTAGWAARVGYDALFSDVNAHDCYKPPCQNAFRRYLCEKYPPTDLKRLFGFAAPEQVRMGEPGEGLLWAETQRHWGVSFARFFAELTAAGQAHKWGFFILPNSSSYANIDEMYKRRRIGHYIQQWARVCPIFMYEKNEQPGRFGKTAISDSILQYKFAFANRTRAGLLLYNAQEAHAVALSNAEAAAMGGGAFIQGHYGAPQVRAAYRAFFESNRDLLDGYSSHAQVGLVFFYDEIFWEDRTHLEQVFCLKDYLCNHHVLWDLIVERNFSRYNLRKYAVVIVPGAQHLSDEQATMLRQYVRAGGGVVMIGEAGRYTDEGAKRDELPFAGELRQTAKQGIRSARLGKGWVAHARRIEDVIRRPAFEIFQLTEDEANETAIIIRMAKKAEARKRPRGADRLLSLCEKLGKHKLSVAGEGVPFTLRVFAYRRRDAQGRRMTVHLLNYDVMIHAHCKSGPPVPAENVTLSVPLPAGWKPQEVRRRGPYAVPGSTLPFAVKAGRLQVTVPQVEIYEALEVRAG